VEQFGVLNYATYVVGTIMIVLLPGPNSLYVLTLAAQRGVRAGWRAAFGIFTGDAVLMLATAAGAVTLLKNYPLLFNVLQYAGACYLAYIGIRLIIAAKRSWPRQGDLQSTLQEPMTVQLSREKPYSKALMVSLLNPKALLFFFSFFVQFVDPSYPEPALPFFILAVTLQVCSTLYLAALIYGGCYLSAAFQQRRRLTAASSGMTGGVFLAFAAKLATAAALV